MGNFGACKHQNRKPSPGRCHRPAGRFILRAHCRQNAWPSCMLASRRFGESPPRPRGGFDKPFDRLRRRGRRVRYTALRTSLRRTGPESKSMDFWTFRRSSFRANGDPTPIPACADERRLTIEKPVTQFDFFGSTWSACLAPKFEDRGFEAEIVLRSSEAGARGYR